MAHANRVQEVSFSSMEGAMQRLDTLDQLCAPPRRTGFAQIAQTALQIPMAYAPTVCSAAAHVAAQPLLLVLLVPRDSSLPLVALRAFASGVTIQPLQMATRAFRVVAFV